MGGGGNGVCIHARVRFDSELDVVGRAGLLQIGDEIIARVVVRVSTHVFMKLIHAEDRWSKFQSRHGAGLRAFGWSIVHDRYGRHQTLDEERIVADLQQRSNRKWAIIPGEQGDFS